MTPQNPYGWWLPLNASAHGGDIDRLIMVVHYFMLVLFVGWGIYLAYVLVRFRERPGHKASAVEKHFRLPTWLEVGVAIFEVFLLVSLSAPVWGRYKNDPPDEKTATVVRVVAEQFAWNVHYPGKDGKFGKTRPDLVDGTNPLGLDRNDQDAKDDIFTINQLHVQVNKPVIVYLSSKDVIHSFFLPILRVKQDVIPGMTIPVWFTPTMATPKGDDAPVFEIACAQLCGVLHSTMRGYLHIDTETEFNTWMAEQEKELQASNSSDSSHHKVAAAE